MAYKSKRTRDLQGEVQAGTNVSVSETTKPDGTKVYILSAEGGSNEFEEVKIIDSDNNVKMLLNTDGVHIYNEDGDLVAFLTKEEITLRDENQNDRVFINRDGSISLHNDNNNETFWFDSQNGNFYLQNELGNSKFSIEDDGNVAVLRLYDEDGNEILNSRNLAKLQDLSLSATELQFGLLYDSNSNTFYWDPNNYGEVIPSETDPSGNAYYEKGYFTYQSIPTCGIKILKQGIYQISIRIELIIATTSQIYLYNAALDFLSIGYEQSGQWTELVSVYANTIQNDTNRYSVIFDYTGYIELPEQSILSLMYNKQSINGIYLTHSFSNYDPFFGLRKIR